jgi:DNA (cytosine-5)-methyltransferase 1
MNGPTIGSLFTGYGGLDKAVERAFDARTVWVSDINPGARKILAHRYPDAPNLGDVTTIDWPSVEPVDIICGGSPCQDLSHASPRRAGMRSGTRSGLWESMREGIAQLNPTHVVWENVRGAYSAAAHSEMEQCPRCVGDPNDVRPVLRALGRVLGDLSDLGYDTQWRTLRAANVGAPHHRPRVFVLATHAHADHAGRRQPRRPVAV